MRLGVIHELVPPASVSQCESAMRVLRALAPAGRFVHVVGSQRSSAVWLVGPAGETLTGVGELRPYVRGPVGLCLQKAWYRHASLGEISTATEQ